MKNFQEVKHLVETKVKEQTESFAGDHDWSHINRVRNIALYIHEKEGVGNRRIVELGALLHDVADYKLVAKNVTYRLTITDWLSDKVSKDTLEHLILLAENVSWSKGRNELEGFSSHELRIVRDADRIDALGAIGVARAFSVGGGRSNALYNDELELGIDLKADAIHHIKGKLLKLYEELNFTTSKQVAKNRHKFTENYLTQFLAEWNQFK